MLTSLIYRTCVACRCLACCCLLLEPASLLPVLSILRYVTYIPPCPACPSPPCCLSLPPCCCLLSLPPCCCLLSLPPCCCLLSLPPCCCLLSLPSYLLPPVAAYLLPPVATFCCCLPVAACPLNPKVCLHVPQHALAMLSDGMMHAMHVSLLSTSCQSWTHMPWTCCLIIIVCV